MYRNARRYARLRGIIAMQMLANANEVTAFAQGSRLDDGQDPIKRLRCRSNADLNEMTKAVASTVKHAPRCGEKLAARRQTPDQSQSEVSPH